MIDVDHQQRQWRIVALRTMPFRLDDFVKGPAVAEFREPVGSRERSKFDFHGQAVFELLREQRGQREDECIDRTDQRADDPRPAMPLRVNVLGSKGNIEDQRKIADVPERIPPLYTVDRGCTEKATTGRLS